MAALFQAKDFAVDDDSRLNAESFPDASACV